MPRHALVLAAIFLVVALLLALTTASPWAQLDAPTGQSVAATITPEVGADATVSLIETPARVSDTRR